jgi:hypothetical protein
MAGRHAPEYPNKIKRKKRKEKRASNDGPHLKLRNKMAAAFVSSTVIHILKEEKGKQEEIIKPTSSVIDMLYILLGGNII